MPKKPNRYRFLMREQLAELFSAQGKQIHLVGIGGVGMAGLAFLLHAKGHTVTGSEQVSSSLTDWLAAEGIQVFFDHDPAHVHAGIDLVIRTTAVQLDNSECQRAVSLNIPVVRRGEAFPVLLQGHRVIAVTGTHGKTTTTAMIAHLLRMNGIPAGHFVGGESEQLGGVARLEEIMVIEADESDGTLVHYHPEILVVTNIEFDHMEHFADETEMLGVFRQAIEQSERVVYCADDRQASALCSGVVHAAPYGGVLDQYDGTARQCSFTFSGRTYQLGLPGKHNAQNALGAFAVGSMLGAKQLCLADFQSVDRRFEWVIDDEEHVVISDYAHHPTEIRAVLEVAQTLPGKRRVVVYQPHRYTRTRMLMNQFPPAFEGADILILAPVYAASETPIEGGTSADLARRIPGCLLAGCLDEAWALVREHLQSGDALFILGAGDVVQLVDRAKNELPAR